MLPQQSRESWLFSLSPTEMLAATHFELQQTRTSFLDRSRSAPPQHFSLDGYVHEEQQVAQFPDQTTRIVTALHHETELISSNIRDPMAASSNYQPAPLPEQINNNSVEPLGSMMVPISSTSNNHPYVRCQQQTLISMPSHHIQNLHELENAEWARALHMLQNPSASQNNIGSVEIITGRGDNTALNNNSMNNGAASFGLTVEPNYGPWPAQFLQHNNNCMVTTTGAGDFGFSPDAGANFGFNDVESVNMAGPNQLQNTYMVNNTNNNSGLVTSDYYSSLILEDGTVTGSGFDLASSMACWQQSEFTTSTSTAGNNGGEIQRAASGDQELVSNTGAYDNNSSAGSSKKTVRVGRGKSSRFRGVTKHKLYKKYEAHLFDKFSPRVSAQTGKKGRQFYLGGYNEEEKAARAFDLAALKFWGPTAPTNFPISNYAEELMETQNMSKHALVAWLRRNSDAFRRGASIYRGVSKAPHSQNRWMARIGRVFNNRDIYLGSYDTEEEAAEAYDIASLKFRGPASITNFDISRYDLYEIANNPIPFSAEPRPRRQRAVQQAEGGTSNGSLAVAAAPPTST